jgi:hypothetical protein
MERRRNDHVAAIPPQFNSRDETDPIAQDLARVVEIELASIAADSSRYRLRQDPVLLLELVETGVTAARWIQVQDEDAGDDAGHDPEIGLRPTPKPLADLRDVRPPTLMDLPGN